MPCGTVGLRRETGDVASLISAQSKHAMPDSGAFGVLCMVQKRRNQMHMVYVRVNRV